MNYIFAIKTAVIVFPILAFLFTGPFILYQYHKFSSINPLKTILIYSFIFYLLCAYFLVIFPLPSKESVLNNPDWMIQIIPFHFIFDFIRQTPLVIGKPITYIKAILDPSFYVVAFNILLMVPLGMFLRYYYNFSLKKIIKTTLLISCFFEFTQLTRLYGIYPKPYRLCDIDDLILNTLGGVVGYLWMKDLEKKLPSKKELEASAYQKGEKISPLRRITLFFLDLFLYTTLIIITKGKHPVLLFIIYFTIIPICYQNKTLGSAFLNIRLKKEKQTPLYYIRPYFLYFYYFILPYTLLWIVNILGDIIFPYSILAFIDIFTLLVIFMFYIANIFILFLKKTPFYDKYFYTKLESTIKEKRNKIKDKTV